MNRKLNLTKAMSKEMNENIKEPISENHWIGGESGSDFTFA